MNRLFYSVLAMMLLSIPLSARTTDLPSPSQLLPKPVKIAKPQATKLATKSPANTQHDSAPRLAPAPRGLASLQTKHPVVAPAIAEVKAAATQVAKDVKKVATKAVARTAAASTQIRHEAAKLARTAAADVSGHLARLTAYWSGEGDYYTGRGIASTGVRLRQGHCAVDPNVIPYGSTVTIAGVGSFLAVDTGSAVISREAAKESGHNATERAALVIDIFFESREDGERFAASGPKFAAISWTGPHTAKTESRESMLADTASAHDRQL